MSRPLSLHHNRQFLYTYRKGKNFVNPLVISYVLPNRLGKLRLGITASKKVGNAVKRNRAKRVIFAAFRTLEPNLSQKFDYVFVARSKTPCCKMQEVLKVMEKQLAPFISQNNNQV